MATFNHNGGSMVNGKQLVDTLMVAVLDEDMLEKYEVIVTDCWGEEEVTVQEVRVVIGTSGKRNIIIDIGDR